MRTRLRRTSPPFFILPIILSVFTLHSTFFTTSAFAQINNESAFYRNNILFFDGNGTENNCSGTGSVFSGNSNAEIVWNFLIAKGFTEEQTAGWLGNFAIESNFDPTIVNPNGGATGLAQWLGGRLDRLFEFAEALGRDPLTLETQLDFLWFELTGEPEVPGVGGGYEAEAYEIILATTSVAEAARVIDEVFERSEGTLVEERIEAALAAFAEFSGTSAGAPANTVCGFAGSSIVGDPLETSVGVACAAGTIDLGIHTGYVAKQPIEHRLCALPNLPSSSSESTPGGAYYIEGANGGSIVNSRVSGAWFALVNSAATAGITMAAASSFRTMEHQEDLYNACVANPTCDPGGAVGSPGSSPHQSGVAIDFAWGGGVGYKADATCEDPSDSTSAAYAWMVENAFSYGFKQYAREHWHWDTLDTLRCSFQ